jgi:very-short-patch-repair endonuclease
MARCGTLPLAGRVGEGALSRQLRRKLRANPTLAERVFWQSIYALRTNGWHFRKQVELGPYYVDFACLHAGLVIEIDGETHGDPVVQKNDVTRDQYLVVRGFRVLRFSNHDVMTNREGVYESVVAALEGRTGNHRATPPPQPSPQGGGCLAGDRGEGEVP